MARLGSDAANIWEVIDVMEITNILKGKRICVSGHLGLPRKEIQNVIKKAGGEFHSDVKYNTSILVTNADFTKGTVVGNKSDKIRRAEAMKIKTMSEQEFIDHLVALSVAHEEFSKR